MNMVFNHAELFITRDHIIRQDRIAPNVNCYLSINDNKYSIVNFSAFGIAVVGEFLETNEWSIQHAIFYVEDHVVIKIEVKACRYSEKDSFIAFEIVGSPLPIDKIESIQTGCDIVNRQRTIDINNSVIPDKFKIVVLELKSLLENIRYETEAAEKKYASLDAEQRSQSEKDIIFAISHYLSNTLPLVYKRTAEFLKPLPSEKNNICVYFLRQLLSGLYESPFVDRCYSKPLGYAGDFKMMNMIYENGHVGNSLFARCLNQVFLNIGSTRAVRNRAEYLATKIYELTNTKNPNPIKILSLASGPANEIQKFLSSYDGDACNIEFFLLDQDINALKYSQLSINKITRRKKQNPQLHFLTTSVRDVIKKGLKTDDFDLIYTAGLFDYLGDTTAYRTAEILFNALAPQGQLIIGNFDFSNPDKLMMDLIMDWPLIYRSRNDLLNLFSPISVPTIEHEEESINLFCVFNSYTLHKLTDVLN